jgi:GTP-binding protein
LLAINKIDTTLGQEHQYDFMRLGFKNTIPISAQHGQGIADLLEGIVDNLGDPIVEIEEEPRCRVVILGKPNVGKSSLLNLLVQEERAIVADIPGTTREAISECIQFYKAAIQVTDTPGVRRKRSVNEPIEEMMVKSAMAALRDTDIVLLMIDGSAGVLADQELKLLFYAFQEQHKAVILLTNKQDIMDERTHETLDSNVDEYTFFMKKIEHLDISCKTGKNIGKVLPLIDTVWKRYSARIRNDELTMLFKGALDDKPLFRQEQLLELFKVEQIKTAPITILLYVNLPQFFGASQLAFFEGLLREHYDLQGVPVRFVLRKR